MSKMRTILLTATAMIAFAANSVLAGAVTLALLLLARRQSLKPAGSWAGAAALFGYAILFSIAYILLGAGTGALILFASVQFGILGWAIFKGDRPKPLEWLGLALAFGGLVYLVSPGLVAPHPIGTALMVAAGLCWAAYTLIGRGSTTPLADTAGNFIRTLPVAVVLLAAGLALQIPSPLAVLYAILSGALASGVGYAVWYAVLPALTRTRAAIVQLTVPAIAALGGIALIGEAPSLRLTLAGIAILGGVALALTSAGRRRS
jgi:drug/metabolite transporter (DMT)-like permease